MCSIWLLGMTPLSETNREPTEYSKALEARPRSICLMLHYHREKKSLLTHDKYPAVQQYNKLTKW